MSHPYILPFTAVNLRNTPHGSWSSCSFDVYWTVHHLDNWRI